MFVNTIVKTVYILFSLFLLLYLSLPNPDFPGSPSGTLQSNEPADTESPDRIAYFTNDNREEIVSHYLGYFRSGFFGLLPNLTLRLNYPPEESQTIIRDQTRSSYLEEIAHPMRESLYVNGFMPTEEKDRIFIGERQWQQKIIVKYVQSHVLIRVVIAFFALILIKVLYDSYLSSILRLKKAVKLAFNN